MILARADLRAHHCLGRRRLLEVGKWVWKTKIPNRISSHMERHLPPQSDRRR